MRKILFSFAVILYASALFGWESKPPYVNPATPSFTTVTASGLGTFGSLLVSGAINGTSATFTSTITATNITDFETSSRTVFTSFVPKAGGTMTGGLTGTTGSFSGPVTASSDSVTALYIKTADDSVTPSFSIRQNNALTYGWDFAADTLADGRLNINAVNAGTPTNAMWFDRTSGETTIVKPLNANSVTASSGTFTGAGGIAATGGGVTAYNRTEAQLQALDCAAIPTGSMFYDSTNMAIVVSTGTGVGAFGLITNGAAQPTGW